MALAAPPPSSSSPDNIDPDDRSFSLGGGGGGGGPPPPPTKMPPVVPPSSRSITATSERWRMRAWTNIACRRRIAIANVASAFFPFSRLPPPPPISFLSRRAAGEAPGGGGIETKRRTATGGGGGGSGGGGGWGACFAPACLLYSADVPTKQRPKNYVVLCETHTILFFCLKRILYYSTPLHSIVPMTTKGSAPPAGRGEVKKEFRDYGSTTRRSPANRAGQRPLHVLLPPDSPIGPTRRLRRLPPPDYVAPRPREHDATAAAGGGGGGADDYDDGTDADDDGGSPTHHRRPRGVVRGHRGMPSPRGEGGTHVGGGPARSGVRRARRGGVVRRGGGAVPGGGERAGGDADVRGGGRVRRRRRRRRRRGRRAGGGVGGRRRAGDTPRPTRPRAR